MGSFPEITTIGWEEIYITSATKRCPLGTRAVAPDGRVFRYAKAGASDLAVGVPVISPAITAWSEACTSEGIGPGTGTTISTTMNTFPLSVSSKMDATALTADTFADGWLFTGSTGRVAGDGQMVQILSHLGATASSTCAGCNFTLYPGQHLITGGSSSTLCFAIFANPYSGVVEATQGAAPTGAVMGVTPCAVTATYYFWLGTWGLFPVEAGVVNAVIGVPAVVCTDTASTGCAPLSSGVGYGQSFVGYVMSPTTTVAGFCMVDVRCSP